MRVGTGMFVRRRGEALLASHLLLCATCLLPCNGSVVWPPECLALQNSTYMPPGTHFPPTCTWHLASFVYVLCLLARTRQRTRPRSRSRTHLRLLYTLALGGALSPGIPPDLSVIFRIDARCKNWSSAHYGQYSSKIRERLLPNHDGCSTAVACHVFALLFCIPNRVRQINFMDII